MSKISYKKFLVKRKIEILFLLFMIFFLLAARIIFPSFKNFIYYFSIIFILFYCLMLIFILRKDVRKERIVREWIRQKDYKILPKNMEEDVTLNEINRLNDFIKDYENQQSSDTNDLKDYITKWTHQIKSPIFALNLLLDDTDVNKEACKIELFEIEEYVQNILGYVRLDSDTTDYAFSMVEVDKEVRSSIKKYARQIIHKNNQISFEETGLTIISDSKWFRFIIDQILSNANKYTRGGMIKIYLEGENLVIEDEGIGINKEDLPRIFDKGYTGFNGRLDKKATGIGLNLVKNICKSLRIEAFADSKKNKGTKIILDLSRIIEEN